MNINIYTSACLTKLFRKAKFIRGVNKVDQLPNTNDIEVAFIGRSNIGKSSLINAITEQHKLAKVSNTPGRTREINFFSTDNGITLVDLPGYGYASAPKIIVKNWTELMFSYLRERKQLQKIMLLIDARHGFKNSDLEVLNILSTFSTACQVILTKADKVRPGNMASVKDIVSHYVILHPEIIITSANTKYGIDTVRTNIMSLLNTLPRT